MRKFSVSGKEIIIAHSLVPIYRTGYLWKICQINNNGKVFILSGDLFLEEELMISFIQPTGNFKINPLELGYVTDDCGNLTTRKCKQTLSEFATKYCSSEIGTQICLELLKDFPVTAKVTYFEICRTNGN